MMTSDEEATLKQELLMADIQLRRKQVSWETPKNVALLAAAIAAALSGFGAFTGYLGFRLGRENPPAPIIIQLPQQAPK
jgi:hypothetical protein